MPYVLTIAICLTARTELTRILAKSRDYDELLHVWKAWRDKTGKPLRAKYLRYVQLSNEAAKLNGMRELFLRTKLERVSNYFSASKFLNMIKLQFIRNG